MDLWQFKISKIYEYNYDNEKENIFDLTWVKNRWSLLYTPYFYFQNYIKRLGNFTEICLK